MKFAIINDIHYGPYNAGYLNGVQRKLTSQSQKLLEEFVTKMNNDVKPAFVVNLGDSIEDVNDRTEDMKAFTMVKNTLSTLKMRCYYLIGNHDVRTLAENEVAELLGYERMYYSFDYEDFHYIALSFTITGDHTTVLKDISSVIPERQLQWLQNDLASTSKDAVVFEHYGLADNDMKGNFWFEKEPHYALLTNRQEVRSILEKSGKVKAVFNAHQHWNSMNVHNNIPYFTVTSLVENTNNDGTASEAHTVVEITKKDIQVLVNGNDSAEYLYKFE